MKDRIRALRDKWNAEDAELGRKLQTLRAAREVLPHGKIDDDLIELLTERQRLLFCIADLQELLFFVPESE